MHFSGKQVKIDAAQGLHTAKALRDAGHPDDWRRSHPRTPPCAPFAAECARTTLLRLYLDVHLILLVGLRERAHLDLNELRVLAGELDGMAFEQQNEVVFEQVDRVDVLAL